MSDFIYNNVSGGFCLDDINAFIVALAPYRQRILSFLWQKNCAVSDRNILPSFDLPIIIKAEFDYTEHIKRCHTKTLKIGGKLMGKCPKHLF